jgi:transposase
MRSSHRTLIRHAMRHMAFLAEEIDALDQDIADLIREANLTPAYELLQTIPGIKSQAAATILAESGPDMKQFPTAANFSSWSGLAPGNNESAGKKKRVSGNEGQPAYQDRVGGGRVVSLTHQRVGVSGTLSTTQTEDRA